MKPKVDNTIVMFLCGVIWFITSFVIFGFIIHNDRMQNWLGQTPMAVETAVCLLLTAIAIFILTLSKK